jgi:DNA-binding SARP family transcriptional activator
MPERCRRTPLDLSTKVECTRRRWRGPLALRHYRLPGGADSRKREQVFAARRDARDGGVGDRAVMPTTHHRLEIRLLGAFDVTIDGSPAGSGGSKRDALLALLALRRGRPVSIDALIDELWGPDVPASPRNAVQHHIARLRATLGQESIVGSGNGYALAGATTDALAFEDLLVQARAALRRGEARTAADAAARALSLWRGPALQTLPETETLRAESQRLEELRVDALEERFEAALELGEHREIVSELQHAVQQSPFRERLWCQLMLALYRSGRAADALETYRSARRVLVEELGLEPGPELRHTQEAILAHDPSIAGAALPLADSRDEIARVLAQLRDSLRHAEELYERVCSSADGIAQPAMVTIAA